MRKTIIRQSIISEITADVVAVENNFAAYDEENFHLRDELIDFVDFHVIDRLDSLSIPTCAIEIEALKQRAETAREKLKDLDTALFSLLRAQINCGKYANGSFKDIMQFYFGNNISPSGKVGYDSMDAFINGLWANQPPPELNTDNKPGMIFYQQTPARIIYEMAMRAGLTINDVFFDLGSGLGHVAIFINLLTGAKTIGVEYHLPYCDYAASCASALSLANVEFINHPAQNSDYIEGSVFFMYSPFEGEILEETLLLLKKESLNRTIRIFTYGPCSKHVAQHDWLICLNNSVTDTYTLYEFRSCTG